jgi:RNA polymerase sigma-70 factor, ECF subfamily
MGTINLRSKSPLTPEQRWTVTENGNETELQGYYSACSMLVARIRSGDGGAMREFYDSFCNRTSGYLRQRLGTQDVADLTHDVFLTVVEAILRNELNDPARLMGFVRTVLQRKIAAHLRVTIRRRKYEKDITEQFWIADSSVHPDRELEFRERTQLMRHVLDSLSRKEREILDRFYLQEQSAMQIRTEMQLTGTNYRVLKSRAKAKFGKTGQHWLRSSRLRNAIPGSYVPLGACA